MSQHHDTTARPRAAPVPLRSNDPHDRPNLGTEPFSIYFYYFRPEKFGSVPRVMFYQSKANKITPATIRRVVADYAECAALGIDVPPPCEPGFAWQKKSFLVIMVDQKGWKFDRPAIVFKTDDGCLDNHTFYHGDYDEVTFQPEGEAQRERQIFYCINHMKQSAGSNQDVGTVGQKFCFEIQSRDMPFDPLSADGTNLGPPVPPPAGPGFWKRKFQRIVRKLRGLVGL